MASSGDVMVVTEVDTTAVEGGQKPGTSGLRKKTKEFMKPNFLENFVQSTFMALKEEEGNQVSGGTLVISGDGRYYNDKAIQTVIKIAVANGVTGIMIGNDGLLSTPAVSTVIRERKLANSSPFGGFILTASHNPGGEDEDFGIKYNVSNGGPAPEGVTSQIFEHTKTITKYSICNNFPTIDIATEAEAKHGDVTVSVFDCTEDHVKILKTCFDFNKIKDFVARSDFTMVYDSMNGVQGPYAKKVLVDELGLPEDVLMNAVPKEDFGGKESPSHGHADPNLTHAVELVKKMGLTKEGRLLEGAQEADIPSFGAAADGDADRNMILGKQFFVSPSDSLAMIAANAESIPWFRNGDGSSKLKACARSMPTSCALDKVAEAKGIQFFEVPTGWKFFGNLMDSGIEGFPGTEKYTPFLCGEESFGTGSDHVREKDGMWAVLAWLQILAAKNEAKNEDGTAKDLFGVQQVAEAHWAEYGRNYYARYDFEGVDKAKADAMMDAMEARAGEWTASMAESPQTFSDYTLSTAEMFNFDDTVDGTTSAKQGLRFVFTDGSRVVFRKSGTGVVGATIRMYLEKYEAKDGNLTQHAFDVVAGLANVGYEISGMRQALFDGAEPTPTVIT